MGENIEKLFYQEVREKKRIGYGAYHNSGRRGGGNKGVRTKTTVDYLRGKARKEYTKGGEVTVSNVYDDIKNVPSVEELKKMDFGKAQHIVGVCKTNFTNAILMEHWGIKTSSSLYSKVFYKYKIVERKTAQERNAIRRGEDPEKFKQENLDKEVIKSYKSRVKELEEELKTRNEQFNQLKSENNDTRMLLDAVQGEVTVLKADAIEVERIEIAHEEMKEEFEELKNKYNSLKNVDYGMELNFKGSYRGHQITERIMKYLETIIDESNYIIDFNIKERIQEEKPVKHEYEMKTSSGYVMED